MWLSVRAVASDTRDPQFESSHRQTHIEHLFTVNCVERTKIKKKREGMAQFLKKREKKDHNDHGNHNHHGNHHHHHHGNHATATAIEASSITSFELLNFLAVSLPRCALNFLNESFNPNLTLNCSIVSFSLASSWSV